MAKAKHPIIARGELYVDPIKKKLGGGPKEIPHEYDFAKTRIINNIDSILQNIEENEEVFVDEKIICVRMEPKFEAKSYVPTSVMSADGGMEIVGGRKYCRKDEQGQEQPAKLYFVKTDEDGIRNLRNTLSEGSKDGVKEWRKQIGSIHSLDFLTAEEKVMGFPDDWTAGNVEIILHPMEDEQEEVLNLFYDISEIPEEETHVRSYEGGLTFISAKCSLENIEQLKALNPLRAIHPLGRISIEPIRISAIGDAPKTPFAKEKSAITVGVFDGGADDTVPLLKGYVNSADRVLTAPVAGYIAHGTGVCGAVLYGNLAGKGKDDSLSPPCVSVESYRVLPLQDDKDFELYEAIDAIEDVVGDRKDIKLFNVSFGPVGAIVDDSISRFTYVLDRLTYDVGETDSNPLFCVAAGNDGEYDSPLNRIQSPSDAVNVLGIGAYTFHADGSKKRAPYSCVGTGREGAKIKPDFLEFGGSIERPFILVGTAPNTLAASCGTSFASPLAVNKIGRMMARSEDISPHLGRALLIHSAEIGKDCSQEEQGFGFCGEKPEDILLCEDNKVTVLYSGTLEPPQTVLLPIFAPKINGVKGIVKISWTVATIVDPYVNDPDAYTNNCIEDVFIPHDMTFNFNKKGKNRSRRLNLLKEEHNNIAKELLDAGYKRSDFPASYSAKKIWDEAHLRSTELKWDTVIKRSVRMRGSSLLNPAITLHAIGRNNFSGRPFRYFVAVSIEAPKFRGSLYDTILQTYQNLTPIEIRNINRIMIKLD